MPPSPPYIVRTQELRELMRRIFPIESAFDAFCLDWFPTVHKHFTSGMDRLQKESMLICVVRACPDLLYEALIEYDPEILKQNRHLFISETPLPSNKIAAYRSVLAPGQTRPSQTSNKRIRKWLKRLWRSIKLVLIFLGVYKAVEWLSSLMGHSPQCSKELPGLSADIETTVEASVHDSGPKNTDNLSGERPSF